MPLMLRKRGIKLDTMVLELEMSDRNTDDVT